MGPSTCAIQYSTAVRRAIRRAISMPGVTAGFTWLPEIGPIA
jgi:hypothetical protein